MKMKLRKAPLATGIILAGLLASASYAQEANLLQVLELAEEGQTTEVLKQVDGPKEAQAEGLDGTTLLHWAVYYDDPELVSRLVELGADVQARNEYGATPLSQAAILGNPEVLQILLDAGADPNEEGADQQTPLMILARTDNLPAAKVLLRAGADVNHVEQWRGQTALMWAAAQRQPEMVKLLLEHGADPDAQSWENHWERQVTAEPRMKILPPGGFTPLLYAAREGCTECTRLLIEYGADINKTDPEGITPMLMATLNAKWDSARLLLEAGANPNKWDIYGRNPLYATVDYNTLPHGGRPDRLSSDLTTSLEMIELLLEAGANPNLQLKLFPPYRALGADRGADSLLHVGVTPLFRAARGGDVPAMELLLEYGAKPDLPSAAGVTPLMAASGFRASDIDTRGRFRGEEEAYATSKLLLDTGEVDINARDSATGQTALFGAASKGYNSVVKLYADYGADLTIEDYQGNTPIDAAMGRANRFARSGGGEEHVDTAALLKDLISDRSNS